MDQRGHFPGPCEIDGSVIVQKSESDAICPRLEKFLGIPEHRAEFLLGITETSASWADHGDDIQIRCFLCELERSDTGSQPTQIQAAVEFYPLGSIRRCRSGILVSAAADFGCDSHIRLLSYLLILIRHHSINFFAISRESAMLPTL